MSDSQEQNEWEEYDITTEPIPSSISTLLQISDLATMGNYLIVLTWLKTISIVHDTYEKKLYSNNIKNVITFKMKREDQKTQDTCVAYFTYTQADTQTPASKIHTLSKNPLLEQH